MHKLSHSTLSNLGTISLKSGNLRVKMSYSEGGPSNGQISQLVIDTGLNIQRRFQCDRAINLCSYKDWPHAGQSQLDAKIEYS